MVAKFLDPNNWKLNPRRRRRERERQKSNRFILTTQQLCTCVTLLYISLQSLHDCDNHMKLPNFTRSLYGVGDHITQKRSFSKHRYGSFGFNLIIWQKIKLNNIDEVWNNANSLFKWYFRFVFQPPLLIIIAHSLIFWTVIKSEIENAIKTRFD